MFRIVSRQFGFPMFATLLPIVFSDQPADAVTYGKDDNRSIKLAFWRGVARHNGLDESSLQIEDVPCES